ncbi:response regulator transcription factor [Herbiconiux sp. YIM B11900]|uniref:response regulator transcription factor n=1 Tax=Herbiconiux sp. YIM B11900 TaxID=3404131 RepID=UPI003F832118
MTGNEALPGHISDVLTRVTSARPAERAHGVLDLMRWQSAAPAISLFRVLPNGTHIAVANSGYDRRVLDYLGSEGFLKRCVGFAEVRARHAVAHDWDTIPGFRATHSARSVFGPAGFRNGLSMYLNDGCNRPIGLLHLALSSEHVASSTAELFRASLSPLADWLRGMTALEQAQLTPREREVCSLIRDGHSNAEIAQELFVSSRTVATHVENVLRKLGLGNRTQVAILAERWGVDALP